MCIVFLGPHAQWSSPDSSSHCSVLCTVLHNIQWSRPTCEIFTFLMGERSRGRLTFSHFHPSIAPVPTRIQCSCLLMPALSVLCHLSLASREHPNNTAMKANLSGTGAVHIWRAQHLWRPAGWSHLVSQQEHWSLHKAAQPRRSTELQEPLF